MSKWINFIDDPVEGCTTSRWWVSARGENRSLGVIRWFGRWRCYAFFPALATVFERTCLRDIADFCEARTCEQRRAVRQRRQAAAIAKWPLVRKAKS